MLTFAYFRYIDPARSATVRPSRRSLYSLVIFGVLVLAGFWLGDRWSRSLRHGPDFRRAGRRPTRRRAAQVPWVIAAIHLVGWTLAGLIWGVLWPTLGRTFDPIQAARVILRHHRHRRLRGDRVHLLRGRASVAPAAARVLPGGGLTAVRACRGCRCGRGCWWSSCMISVIPVTVLGVLARNRARTRCRRRRGGRRDHRGMLVSRRVPPGRRPPSACRSRSRCSSSRSVAEPLAQLEAAMARGRARPLRRARPGRLQRRDRRGDRGLQPHGARACGSASHARDLRQVREPGDPRRDPGRPGRAARASRARSPILFADIRDFTPWVEASDPREVVRDLNAYFTRDGDGHPRARRPRPAVHRRRDRSGVRRPGARSPRHAEHAVRAALEMRRRLAAWNAARARRGQAPLRNGIGIHTGTVLAGNIGSADRLSYALVGDAVNLASRIQGLTKECRRRRARQRGRRVRASTASCRCAAAGRAREGTDGRGGGLRARLSALGEDDEAVGERAGRRGADDARVERQQGAVGARPGVRGTR